MSAHGPRPAVRLAIWCTATIALLAVVLQARFTADLSAFLPSAPDVGQQLLVDQLRRGPVSRVLLLGIESRAGGTAGAAERAAASTALARKLLADGTVRSAGNGAVPDAGADRALLFDHRYLLGDAVEAGRLRGDGLRDAIRESLDMLASPIGLLYKDLIPRDPTGEVLRLVERLEPAETPATAHGVWTSADRRRALLLVELHVDGTALDAQQAALAAIDAAFDAVRAGGQPDLVLRVSGTARFAVDSRDAIRNDVERLSAIGTALILVLLLSVYRSPLRLLLGLVPVATGALAGLAAVALAFGQVHGITVGFGVALIGEGVDYAVYLFVQGSSAALWRTVRLGVLTSLAGFVALLFSSFPGLAQLGLFAVTGIAVAALVSWWVVAPLVPAQRLRLPAWLGERLPRALLGLRRWPTLPIVAAVAATIAIGLTASQRPLWTANLEALSPVSEAARRLDAEMRADLRAPDLRFVVAAKAPDADAALALAQQATRRLLPLVAAGALGGFDSPSLRLPDGGTQRARQAALPEAATLRADLERATRDTPLRAERLAPFLEDIERSRTREPVRPRDLDGTPYGAAVGSLLVPSDTGVTALLPLRAPAGGTGSIDATAIRAALAAPRENPPGTIHLLDLKSQTDALYGDYLREAILLSAAGALLIVLLLSPQRRSRWRRVMLPLGASVACVVASLALAGTGLTILHLVGLLLTVAVGSNYALFFDGGGDDPRLIASLLLANMTTVIGFGVLAFSSAPVLSALGLTVGPGALLSLLFAAMASGGGRPAAGGGR